MDSMQLLVVTPRCSYQEDRAWETGGKMELPTIWAPLMHWLGAEAAWPRGSTSPLPFASSTTGASRQETEAFLSPVCDGLGVGLAWCSPRAEEHWLRLAHSPEWGARTAN